MTGITRSTANSFTLRTMRAFELFFPETIEDTTWMRTIQSKSQNGCGAIGVRWRIDGMAIHQNAIEAFGVRCQRVSSVASQHLFRDVPRNVQDGLVTGPAFGQSPQLGDGHLVNP